MTIGFIDIEGDRLEYLRIAPDRPGRTLVFLHEGLGSVAAWRDFPRTLCDRLAAPGFVYSRRGYGLSSPEPQPRGTDYLHREAHEVLPALLAALGIAVPLLVGHSDGGSIALLHAARATDDPGTLPAAIAIMAPHVLLEDVSLQGIRAARIAWHVGGPQGKLQTSLAAVHADAASAFFGWNDIWLEPTFAHWNIEREIEAVTCPVLAIQGEQDQYGTMDQLDRIARAVSGPCRLLKLDRCGHAPHRDQPEAVIDAIAQLYGELA
ncbi:MAG: alpha/beta hydrolase [Burkholderiaceae bacterium]|nr:alpha/beta hydrolase [Burkholderiaceae bacterium]